MVWFYVGRNLSFFVDNLYVNDYNRTLKRRGYGFLTVIIMENKKLIRISKKDLLETLLVQTKRIEELEIELEKLNKKLLSRKITIEESGNLAEASLAINKIFEATQKAADDYMYNIIEKCKKMEAKTKKECQKMQQEMEKKLKTTKNNSKKASSKKISEPSKKSSTKKKEKGSK